MMNELVPKLIDYALKRMVRTFGSMDQALGENCQFLIC
jgi:hypothetical protein